MFELDTTVQPSSCSVQQTGHLESRSLLGFDHAELLLFVELLFADHKTILVS